MDRPDQGGHDHDGVSEPEERVAVTCHRHPDRPTRLRCSECNRPICVECSHDSAVGQRCPDCAKPKGRHRVVRVRTMNRASFSSTPVTFTILAINVLIFLAGDAIDVTNWSVADWIPVDLVAINNQLFGHIGGVATGEWWRVVTGTFFHGGAMHILFNMYALYVLGPQLERQAGPTAFGGLYFATAIVGSLTSILLTGPTNPWTSLDQIPWTVSRGVLLVPGYSIGSIGASGAIFGLFGAWLWAGWRLRHTPGGRVLLNQFGLLLLINAALPLFVPNIDWRAHLGGLVAGVVIAAAWSKFAVGRHNARALRTIIAGGVAVLGLLVAMLI